MFVNFIVIFSPTKIPKKQRSRRNHHEVACLSTSCSNSAYSNVGNIIASSVVDFGIWECIKHIIVQLYELDGACMVSVLTHRARYVQFTRL